MTSNPDSSTRELRQCYPQSYIVAKEKHGERKHEFSLLVSIPYLKGALTCRKILHHRVDGFSFPPKKVVLGIFITLKNPSSSAGFELVNLGTTGKHATRPPRATSGSLI
jgi:hypothetical protein